MAKKSKPETVAPGKPEEMKPRIHLDGKHAEGVGSNIGDMVHFSGHGKLVSRSMHEYDGEPSHSATIEVHSMKHGTAKEGYVDNETGDGMKSAMDEALSKSSKPKAKGKKAGKKVVDTDNDGE
jgi:hypothetical protein